MDLSRVENMNKTNNNYRKRSTVPDCSSTATVKKVAKFEPSESPSPPPATTTTKIAAGTSSPKNAAIANDEAMDDDDGIADVISAVLAPFSDNSEHSDFRAIKPPSLVDQWDLRRLSPPADYEDGSLEPPPSSEDHQPLEDAAADPTGPDSSSSSCCLACTHCAKFFWSDGDLKHHLSLYHGEKSFVCEMCGKAFRFRSNLAEHRSVHTSIKPYVCKFCGKSSRLKGNLTKHILKHHKREQSAYIGKEDVIIRKGKKSIKDPAALDFLEKSMIILSPEDMNCAGLQFFNNLSGKTKKEARASGSSGSKKKSKSSRHRRATGNVNNSKCNSINDGPKHNNQHSQNQNVVVTQTQLNDSNHVTTTANESSSSFDFNGLLNAFDLQQQQQQTVPASQSRRSSSSVKLSAAAEDASSTAGTTGTTLAFDTQTLALLSQAIDNNKNPSSVQPIGPLQFQLSFERLLAAAAQVAAAAASSSSAAADQQMQIQPGLASTPTKILPSTGTGAAVDRHQHLCNLSSANFGSNSANGGGTKCILCGKHFRKATNLAEHVYEKHSSGVLSGGRNNSISRAESSSGSSPAVSASVASGDGSSISGSPADLLHPELLFQGQLSPPPLKKAVSGRSVVAAAAEFSSSSTAPTIASPVSSAIAERRTPAVTPKTSVTVPAVAESGLAKDLREIKTVFDEIKRRLPDTSKVESLLASVDDRIGRLENQVDISLATLYSLVQMQSEMNLAFFQFKSDVFEQLKSLQNTIKTSLSQN